MKWAIVLALAVMPVMGQTKAVISIPVSTQNYQRAYKMVGPTKCPDYKHLAYYATCEQGYSCRTDHPDHVIANGYCVDDVHTVTEREWQELMARLKALESHK